MSNTQILSAVFVAIAFIICMWALVDILKRPSWAFREAHVNRALWILVMVFSWICGIGTLAVLWYLILVGPKVRRMEHLGARPGFPRRT